MENNQLVPVQSTEKEEQEITFVKSKRKPKNKKTALKGLFALFLIALGFIICLNYDKIQSYFDKDTDSNFPTESNTDTESSDDSSDEQITDIIPSGCYGIIEANKSFQQLKNESTIDVGALDLTPIKASEIYEKYGNDAPVVLIIHSSVLECYSNGKYYNTSDSFYSNEKNVGQIGKIICDKLNANGIKTIHIDSIFANGGIYSSTSEYESAIKQALKSYPSIEYVFDISRDITINDDLTMEKPVAYVNDIKMAQAKIVVGSSASNSFWEKNLSLALKLATSSNDIVCDVTLSAFSLSQELSPSCLQIDIGCFSNTYEEATLLAKEIADRISGLIS